MKITQIEAFALRYQKEKPDEQQTDNYYLPDEGWRCIYARHHETMVVRITTSDGIVGYGEGQSPVLTAYIKNDRRGVVSSDTHGKRPV